MKKYVLQMQTCGPYARWIALDCEFDTLEEAKAALAQKREPWYRIAEAYTVIRYKPVKL